MKIGKILFNLALVVVLQTPWGGANSAWQPAPTQAAARVPAAAVYYVDFANGNDANSGDSATAAWQHAPGDPAATGNPDTVVLQPGDTVLFRGGVTYRGQVFLPASGAAGNPITYKGDGWGGEKAIVDGSEVLGGWLACPNAAACGDNPNWAQIYYTDGPEELEPTAANLHEGDDFLWVAQEPDMPDPYFMDNIDAFYAISPTQITTTSLSDPAHLNQPNADYWDNSYVLVWHIPNIVTLRRITGYIPAENRITFDDLGGGGVYTDRDTKYSIYNSLHALDQAGEYYINPTPEAGGAHRVYLWPRSAANLLQGITYSVRNIGFDIAGKSYVTIEGFIIQKHRGLEIREGGGISTVTATTARHTGLVIRNNLIRHNRQVERGGYGGIYLQHARDSLVENNVIVENPWHHGIFLAGSRDSSGSSCDHNTVRGNIISKPGSTGITFYTCAYSQIVGNRVDHSLGSHANGITAYLQNNDILIAYNQIFESASPLTFQEIHNLTIYNNLIDAGELGSNINEWSATSTGQVAILNNLLIRNNRNAALNLAGSGATYIVKNNVIDGGGWSSNAPFPLTHTHNIYTGLRWDQDEDDLHPTEILEPDLARIFADPASLDYRLAPGGPAVDAGEDVMAYLPVDVFPDFDFTPDLGGRARPWGARWDIGVYEFFPDLALYGTPANQSIRLNWSVNVTLPVTTTWAIAYAGPPGDEPSPITGIPPATRTYTLTGLTNNEVYTVTLTAIANNSPILTDTVRVTPTGQVVFLPLAARNMP